MQIFKYEITGGANSFEDYFMRVLTAQMQGDKIVVWAEVDTENTFILKKHRLNFYLVGTGWQVSDEKVKSYSADNRIYVGTVQDQEGYVWHVYYDIEY